jgi:K+-transporting ATPase ATPase B chain
MFVVWIGAILTSVLAVQSRARSRRDVVGFVLAIALLLWITVLFANFAEAVAEGRGKAQAQALRSARADVTAKRLVEPALRELFTRVPAPSSGRATSSSSRPAT